MLWAGGLFGHLVLLAVLVVRRRAAEFPFFTALMALSVVRTCLLAILLKAGADHAYLVTYVSTQVMDVSLQLVVVYEVASHVFRPLARWAPDTRQGILVLSAVSVLVAGVLTSLAAPVQGNWRSMLMVHIAFFSSALMSELFVGMVALSVTAGLPWKTHVARIAHGLGVYSLVELAVESVHTLHGGASTPLNAAWTYVRMSVYLLCLGYWTVTLWRQAPAMRALPPGVRKDLRGLQNKLAYDLYTLRSWKKP